LTIIEVVVALSTILVVVIGALSFQYYCAVDAREADVRAGANRLALLMLEGWRGAGGRVPEVGEQAPFNPVGEFRPILGDDNIRDSSVGLPGLSPGQELGRYRVVLNRVNYFVTLSYDDGDPRTLSVTVSWSRNYKSEELSEHVRLVSLTTKVES